MHKTAHNEVLNSILFQQRSTFVKHFVSFRGKRFLFTLRRGNDSNCGEYVKMAKVDGVCKQVFLVWHKTSKKQLFSGLVTVGFL